MCCFDLSFVHLESPSIFSLAAKQVLLRDSHQTSSFRDETNVNFLNCFGR